MVLLEYHHFFSGQSLVALTRALGPFLSGNVFAWSASNELPFPFNYHFVFNGLAILMVPIVIFGRLLPTRLNVPKIEQFELLEDENEEDLEKGKTGVEHSDEDAPRSSSDSIHFNTSLEGANLSLSFSSLSST